MLGFCVAVCMCIKTNQTGRSALVNRALHTHTHTHVYSTTFNQLLSKNNNLRLEAEPGVNLSGMQVWSVVQSEDSSTAQL